MPPHYQMAMVQSLLVRSLVAWFWDEPLRAPLIRHGANLHGRYLLPHFIIHDIAEVAADLRAHGIDFDTSWLDPFTEFRFPRIGTAVFDGVEIELRGAIEPWNVLGEESTAGGTARYVDSSVERHPGAAHRRRPAPLRRHRATATRSRCWPPTTPTSRSAGCGTGPGSRRARCTRPSPSTGRCASSWSTPRTGMSRGGCTYHVSHPGGRSYDNPPVNAVEAESRRGRRFEATGFTPGQGRHVRHPREAGAPVAPTWARRASWICAECVPFCSDGTSAQAAVRARLRASARTTSTTCWRRYRTVAGPAGAVRPPPAVRGTGYDEFVDAAGNVRPGLAGAGRMRRRARPRRTGPAAADGAQPASTTTASPTSRSTARRRGHQRRRHRGAGAVASRRAAAGDRRRRTGTRWKPVWCSAPGCSTPC